MPARSLVALLCAVPAFGAPTGAVIREPGAIYMEDFVPKAVKVQVTSETPIYYKIDMQRYLGTIPKGQVVELQAVSEIAYRIRGKAQQGQVVGWVDSKNLTPLRPEFLQALRDNAARKVEVDALIARNEVALNMTPEEVTQSLGKPSKKTSKLDAGGRMDTWEFVRFERVPQEVSGYDRYGRLVRSVVYVKVPAGKLSVRFNNNLVTGLEQTEGTIERDARVKIVSAPLVVGF